MTWGETAATQRRETDKPTSKVAARALTANDLFGIGLQRIKFVSGLVDEQLSSTFAMLY